MRRWLLHPAWLPVVLVAVFVAGAALGDHTGGDQTAATVTRRVTLTTTQKTLPPAFTVTLVRTKTTTQPPPTNTAGVTSSAVTMRYGRWYGKFRGTGLSMTTSGVGAEIVGQLENTRACSQADVTLDATFYRDSAVVGSGTGYVTAAPEGTPVSLDVIGYPTETPDRATVVISDVLCA